MADTRKEIETLEQRFWQSMVDNDADAATALLHEPAVLVSGHGVHRFDHAGYRDMARQARYRITSFALSDFQVVDAGDAAVATYTVRQVLEVQGRTVEQEVHDSSTWVRIDGAWRCVSHTESEPPAKA